MTSIHAKALAQIIDDTLRLCGDFTVPGGNGRRWSVNDAKRVINASIIDTVRITHCLKGRALVVLEEDVNVYTLPADCYKLLRLSFQGTAGWVILPKGMDALTVLGGNMVGKADPIYAYRDTLAYNQVAFWPIPRQDGSTFTTAASSGLLRRITDADGNEVTYDANLPLRQIRGRPFRRMGDGAIIRQVADETGNVVAEYVRAPFKLEQAADVPDLPGWFHQYLKYPGAIRLLMGGRQKVDVLKVQIFGNKWYKALGRLKAATDTQGLADEGMAPS
jgi:hypothetical protein